MDAIGLGILGIVGLIVVLALIKILLRGKEGVKQNKNQVYSAIGLLVLIITIALTIIF